LCLTQKILTGRKAASCLVFLIEDAGRALPGARGASPASD
jgi:hypothetical protein